MWSMTSGCMICGTLGGILSSVVLPVTALHSVGWKMECTALIHCNIYMNLKNMGKLWMLHPPPLLKKMPMRAAVLRLLLTAGLFTQHVISQQAKDCDCERGGILDIEHVSWHCRHYDKFSNIVDTGYLELG